MLSAPFQNEVAQFVGQHNLEIPVGDRMLDLTSEIGELANVILKVTDYGRQEFYPDAAWRDELGDVLFSLTCLANSIDIDLLDALREVMTQYQARQTHRGNTGSDRR